MRLLGITIDEFRMIDDQWLPAGGLVVLFGPNSAGKTSVLEAAGELLRVASSSRIDPGVPWDVFAVGSVRFTLPGAEISDSPDSELYQALLKGDYPGGGYWEQLEYERASLLGDKSIDEAREFVASRLADTGQAGGHPDRLVLARAMLQPTAVFFVTHSDGVFMYVNAACVPDDAIEAAHPIMAADAGRNDFLGEIAVGLITQEAAVIGWVADRDDLAEAFPPVIVLDGALESLAADLRTTLPVIHDRLWGLHYPREPTAATASTTSRSGPRAQCHGL